MSSLPYHLRSPSEAEWPPLSSEMALPPETKPTFRAAAAAFTLCNALFFRHGGQNVLQHCYLTVSFFLLFWMHVNQASKNPCFSVILLWFLLTLLLTVSVGQPWFRVFERHRPHHDENRTRCDFSCGFLTSQHPVPLQYSDAICVLLTLHTDKTGLIQLQCYFNMRGWGEVRQTQVKLSLMYNVSVKRYLWGKRCYNLEGVKSEY